MVELFAAVPLFILFREAIEASIVVSVLLAFLARSHVPELKRQVWWGVGAGVAIAVLLGVIFAVVFYTAQNNLFSGQSQLIFKGVVCWIATIFITFLAFAMLRYQNWEQKWARKFKDQGVEKMVAADAQPDTADVAERGLSGTSERAASRSPSATLSPAADPTDASAAAPKPAKLPALELSLGSPKPSPPALTNILSTAALDAPLVPNSDEASPKVHNQQMQRGWRSWWFAMLACFSRVRLAATSASGKYALFIVVFFTVLREGLESVVFLLGVGNSNPAAIPISGLIGVACGVMVGVLLYYSGKQVKDIKWLLIIFSIVLFFIAAGACKNGASWLMRGGAFGTYVPPIRYVAVAVPSSGLYGGEDHPPAPPGYVAPSMEDDEDLPGMPETDEDAPVPTNNDVGPLDESKADSNSTHAEEDEEPEADSSSADAEEDGEDGEDSEDEEDGEDEEDDHDEDDDKHDSGFSDGDDTVDYQDSDDPTIPQPWYMKHMWDISACCGDKDEQNKFLSIASQVVGYTAKPTAIDAIFYLGYWGIVLSFMAWKWHRGTLLDADWKHTRMMKEQREREEQEAKLAVGSDRDSDSLVYDADGKALHKPPAREQDIELTEGADKAVPARV